ncbi:MAG TPA: Coenzyme F420 hydrogenase/dehydrogenase, beta subunit C-terminal domain [Candidatus Megamonas gallistercoris]|nr:Coenzyme F420 hydrogenase/dehydrogenase, beta subunit C-terminal domain [Candidatus Megamonas gallistercoris]
MLCTKEKCTGCLSCLNICPKNAINLINDSQGFWQPEIDETKCIHCGLCHKSCPVFFKPATEVFSSKVYACWHKDEKCRQQAASGGLFTALMQNALKRGFLVCGATLTDDIEVKHIIIDKPEDYTLLIGSKYVQSDLSDIFRQIRTQLLNGRKILFSGTPCQVAGLYAFLKKRYENQLYTVDLLCHGVPSPHIFKQYIDHMEHIYSSKITDFQFRHKPDWRRYQVILKFANGKKDITYKDTNPYIRGFLNANFLRPSCYSCDYTTLKRYSDLTIGDFWNYFADGSDDVDDDKGISLLLINNANGQNLFNSAKSDLIYFAKDFERSTATSPRLHSPTKKPVTYESFWQDYKIHDFAYMIQKYF